MSATEHDAGSTGRDVAASGHDAGTSGRNAGSTGRDPGSSGKQLVVCQTIQELRTTLSGIRVDGRAIGFVPTMGALHEGHLSLIRQARDHADCVVVSIFVNPTQFGPGEDFDRYPRPLEADLEACRRSGADVVFTPVKEQLYDGHSYFTFGIDQLADHLCGASRPGFFQGVVQIVNKLFNIVQPDVAVFGQKDYQQFRILERMTQEFHQPVHMVMAPIVRADDGLALSSRNAYLSDEERVVAPSLYRSLSYIRAQILDGVDRPSRLLEHQKEELRAKGFEIDYLGIYSAQTLQPIEWFEEKDTLLAGAVWLGNTRLIDNLLL